MDGCVDGAIVGPLLGRRIEIEIRTYGLDGWSFVGRLFLLTRSCMQRQAYSSDGDQLRSTICVCTLRLPLSVVLIVLFGSCLLLSVYFCILNRFSWRAWCTTFLTIGQDLQGTSTVHTFVFQVALSTTVAMQYEQITGTTSPQPYTQCVSQQTTLSSRCVGKSKSATTAIEGNKLSVILDLSWTHI